MTVPSSVNRSGPYNGNGVTTFFNYGFRILDESHLTVIKTVGGVETVLTIDADYVVSDVGADAGGQIAVTPAPASGSTITILRNVPFTQETDLENQGAYFAETIEGALDRGVMRDQQLSERLDRTVTIPASADGSTLDALIEDVLRLADSADAIDTVAGIAANVTTVAGIAANVTTVAGIAANVTTVAGVAASVSAVAAVDDEVVAVAGNAANINAVAGIGADVSTVAGAVADVSTVATDIAAVVDASTNMVAIVAAPDAAASAATSADAAAATLASSLKKADNLSDVSSPTLAAGNLGLLFRGTVADYLADTVMDYSAGTGKIAVVAGQFFEAGGFRYQVAASGASDHHVTNANGVKAYVVPVGGQANIQAFGAVPDYDPVTKTGTPVDGYFNALMTFCIAAKATAVIVGSYYSQGGMAIASPVRIYADCSIYCDNSVDNVALEIGTAGSQFSTSGNGNSLLIGDRFVLRKIRDANNKPAWWTNGSDTSVGSLEHSLVNARFYGFEVDGFAKNRVWEATNTAYATNYNHNCACTNGINNIKADITGTGYVNENRWFGGLITNASGPDVGPLATVESIALYTAETNKPNNNHFFGVNMEDHVSPVVFKTNGIYNWLNGCRLEGLVSQSVVFDTGTTNNRVTQCYGITNRGSAPIKDDGTNIFDVGKPFYAGADLFGVYQGQNLTTATDGGPAKYPLIGSPHHSDRSKLAAALGEGGLGTFRSDRQDYPGLWMDAPTSRLYIGAGLGGLFQFLSGSTNNWDIIANAVGASASMGGMVMGGRYNEGHLTLRANSKDYHFWVDSSGNLRAGATAVNGKPGSNTAGNVVAATIPDI